MGFRVDRALRATLSHLEILLREAGDNETGDLLKTILESPGQITALHQIFASNLKRSIRDDSAFSERHSWFQSFSSQSGEALDEKQVNKLTKITRNWALTEERVEALLLCSVLWSSCPQLFWDGDIPDQNIFRRCFVDLERIREIDPLRRKVLLIILSQRVQEEQRQLRINGKRQRSRLKHPNANRPDANRKRMFLPSSLRVIVQRLWPDADVAKQRKTKKSISLYSRFGWKWQHIEPQGIILSLPDSAAKSYEIHSWSSVEFEAINLFVKTLPQYRIRSHLQRAMGSLMSHYYGKTQLEAAIHDTLRTTEVEIPVRLSLLAEPTSDQYGSTNPHRHSFIAEQTERPGLFPDGSNRSLEAHASDQGGIEFSSGGEQTAETLSSIVTSSNCGLDGERPRQFYQEPPGSPLRFSPVSAFPERHQYNEKRSPSVSLETYQMTSPPASPEISPRPNIISEPLVNPPLSSQPTSNSQYTGYGETFAATLIPQHSLSWNVHNESRQQPTSPFESRCIAGYGQRATNSPFCTFNDTSFAMESISQEHSIAPNIPFINDTSIAMQWFASEAEGLRRMSNFSSVNTPELQSNLHQQNPWVSNDTSAALLRIAPGNESTVPLTGFNDTNIAMSAFVPETLDMQRYFAEMIN